MSLSTRFCTILLSVSAQVALAQTAQPPARTYFKDDDGVETKVVHERWFEDENGERHGKYIEYNSPEQVRYAGNLKSSLTYVHGRLIGPAVLVDGWGAKDVGSYKNAERVGVWLHYGALNGTLLSKTTYNEQGVRIAYVDYRPKQPTPKPVEPVAPKLIDFYTFRPDDREVFLHSFIDIPDSFTPITGAKLLDRTNLLTTGDFVKLVSRNTGHREMPWMFKASKSLGANPMKLFIGSPALTNSLLGSLLAMHSAQLDGEALYYGLRGSETEKGHGTPAFLTTILEGRVQESDEYKKAIADSFYACAKAANDAYSDPKKYPLRRWLYEQYKDDNPLMRMNSVTKADPVTEPQFPPTYN